MKGFHVVFSLITLSVFCPIHKSIAQTTEELSDSLVYSIVMYKEMFKDYADAVSDLKFELCAVVAEVFGVVESSDDFTISDFNGGKVNTNTKLKDLGADLYLLFDLTERIGEKYGVFISDEQAMQLSTVENVFDLVRPTADTVMLGMAYYPWRMVFDSRKVHRVSVYEDGIGILEELMKLTSDSIQREIYLNELMNVYDVWCEYVDSINERTDVKYSKTLIKSEKAGKYIRDYMPIVYGMSRDSITKANVTETFAVKAYTLLRDALYESDHKEDLNHVIPIYYFPLSQAYIAYFHANKNTKAFEKQYHADFDTVYARLSYMLTSEDINEKIRRGNIRPSYDNIKQRYDATCDELNLVGVTDWKEKETIFRNQLAEKRELWDFGVEIPNADFLDRIIRAIRTDSSDVYVEALECYVEYIVPKSQNISEEKVNEYKKKRNSLVKAYLKRERYDEAYNLLEELIRVERNNIEKADQYYIRGLIQFTKKNFLEAAKNLKNSVKYNPNHGDALRQLALAYANCKFSNDEYKDRLKYNLVVEKLQEAKRCIISSANSVELGKYNTISNLEQIDKEIEAYKTHFITAEDFHGATLASKYNVKKDGMYKYDEGVMRGESAIIRTR